MKKLSIAQLKTKVHMAFYINEEQHVKLKEAGVNCCQWYNIPAQSYTWYNNQGTYWSNSLPSDSWERVEINFSEINDHYSIF